MPNSPLLVALVVAFTILSLGIHEAAHAWVAKLRGDDTAQREGRLTLNPIAHIDPIMTILVPAIMFMTTGFVFGGARPVPVNYHRLKSPARDMMLVAIAGPISNFLLAIMFFCIAAFLLGPQAMDSKSLAVRCMIAAARMNVVLTVFNLLPIPPLDGSRVMAWILPESMRESYVAMERYGLLILVLVLYSGALNIRALMAPVENIVIAIADAIVPNS